jgi:hypothetical protein
MRSLLAIATLALAASPAMAAGSFGVPAPLIGAGIPAAIVVGAAFVIVRFLKRRT